MNNQNMHLDCIALISYQPLGERGEDAYAYNAKRGDIHTIAVFDGCGGSGAWRYAEFRNATGAFVAAQRIATCYQEWFQTLNADDARRPRQLGDSLLTRTRKTLTGLKAECAPMGISGSMVKSFPCTASAAVVTQTSKNAKLLTALNAGDSRVYYLTPDNGLVQLTQDDSRGRPDPLDSLQDNAPLSNLLNADKPYSIKTSQAVLKMPCAIMCATDGVFGFVRSPMDFEYMLLTAIMACDTIAQFEDAFTKAIIELTGDDSTCMMLFYGWGDYPAIKNGLMGRYKHVAQIIAKIERAENASAMNTIIRQQWETYKATTIHQETSVSLHE